MKRHGNVKDMAGRRFGRLLVLRYVGASKWTCLCACGKETRVDTRNLNSGGSTSCGCFQKENATRLATKHGLSHAPEHNIWQTMINRCHLPSTKKYSSYGGRGIHVCKRWREDFAAFYADMGPRPSSAHSIERLDNNGPYSPDNCEWATRLRQANNTRTNLYLTVGGERLSAAEWARRTGIPPATLVARVRRGWSHADAVGSPIGTIKMRSRSIIQQPTSAR